MRSVAVGASLHTNFYAVLASDHLTPATGKTWTAQVCKNGAIFVAAANAPTELSDGWYDWLMTGDEAATPGPIAFRATAADADPVNFLMQVEYKADGIISTVNDASAGTSSFITALASTENDMYKDAYLTFYSAASPIIGAIRRILAYDGSTKRVTCVPFSSAPPNGAKFLIVRS